MPLTTGTRSGADGQQLCRRPNVGAVGIASGCRPQLPARRHTKNRRHKRRYADGNRRHIPDRRFTGHRGRQKQRRYADGYTVGIEPCR